jgi:hypothetical protein
VGDREDCGGGSAFGDEYCAGKLWGLWIREAGVCEDRGAEACIGGDEGAI